MAPCPGCERRDLLLWHAAGKLSGDEAALVSRALETCSRCRAAYDMDRLLAVSVRAEARPSPEELLRLAESPQGWTGNAPPFDEVDREIFSILRAIQADEARQETSFAGKLRGLGGRAAELLGRGEPALRPAWAVLAILLLAYPAYRGMFPTAPENGPRLLAQPHALGEPSRSSAAEATVLQAGTDSVITVFVPVDPANRYSLTIEHESGRRVFHTADAVPFDGIGTFAVLLPSSSLTSGRYEIRIEEIDASDPTTDEDRHRFIFTVE